MSTGKNPDAAGDLSGRRILLVEDEEPIANVVRGYLQQADFLVDMAADGFSALHLAQEHSPDLIILDRMLPGLDGAEVCRRIRETMSMPIILLTALGTEDDRILGLEMGADDYVTKPFSPRELVLRVKSQLRRSIHDFMPEPPVQHSGFLLDPAARAITARGVPLVLTAREFDLLAFFLRRPNQVFSREELISYVWGWDFGDLSTVTVHVRRVREKIEDNPTKPLLLKTVWGVGYRFDMDAEAEQVGEGSHGQQ
ncbi:response regulator transcription factor [Arthrobacter sp. H35-D1]|uniref:response regulator transcription factor n=1 Tax=Arthrobacter sp. H35-D1 TaxID=3046202 RepID=UPI0024BA7454|nr:response regulator transcription factor [Arthrobacter sp. H35-D1]MDJ0313605.1 response regulator transcription factor [Arthrobacter sp. H35-D1]